jgi:hypothetical protein
MKTDSAIPGLLSLTALFVAVVSVSFCNTSCQVPRARIVYDGNYGTYSYSAKEGFEARLRSFNRLKITPEK